MREIRPSGLEGGGAGNCSPYPYPFPTASSRIKIRIGIRIEIKNTGSMPKINLSVPHSLGQEEAKRRIADWMAQSRGQFAGKISDVAEAWNGYVDTFHFRAMGFALSGTLEVQPAALSIEMTIPWAALPLQGRLESEILTRARQLLD